MKAPSFHPIVNPTSFRTIRYQDQKSDHTTDRFFNSGISKRFGTYAPVLLALFVSFFSSGFFTTSASCLGQIFRTGGLVQKTVERQESTNRLARKIQAGLSNQVREIDELWVINARSAVSCPTKKCQKILCDVDVAQKIDGCWQEFSMEKLLERINEDEVRKNVVFIHGNRTDFQWAKLRGTEIYEAVIQPECDPQECRQPEHGIVDGCDDANVDKAVGAVVNCRERPVRWIIWAWPSDKICGPKKDLELKQSRAVDQGRLLATFFNRVVHQRLSVVAYSLGAKAFSCCLESIDKPELQNVEFVKNQKKSNSSTKGKMMLASVKKGKPTKSSVEELENGGKTFSVVMIAAAVPSCWVRESESLARHVEGICLINNPGDRVLRVYKKLTHSTALGSETSVCDSVVPCKIRCVTNRRLVNHFLDQYLENCEVRHDIRSALLLGN